MTKKFYILLAALVALSASAADRATEIRNRLLSRDTTSVIVASHRADWRNFPENSLEGIQSAIDMGVDIVELDVQMTKDSVLILMHDGHLDRTSTGHGLISDTTLDQIRQLNLRNGCAIRTGQRIPTLEEALLLAKGKIMINLDKADRYFDQVYALLEKTGTTDQIIMKGGRPAAEVREQFGPYLDKVIYMPIVNLDQPDASQQIDMFVSDMNPVAFELLYVADSNTLPFELEDRLAGKSLIWYNTLWDTMAGGHDDDASLKDINNGWGFLIDRLGCRMIQTDRPAMLLEYLRSRNLHD